MSCIDNLNLYYDGTKISHNKYPFLSIKTSKAKLELKINGNIVTLIYLGIKFMVSENDYNYEAENLIKKAFSSEQVKILDSHENFCFNFKSTEKYKIQVTKMINFYDIDKNYLKEYIYIDYMDTVSDVQKKLAKNIDLYNEQNNPEKIIIYDSKKNQITDLKNPLINFQNLNELFYYKNTSEKKKTMTFNYKSDFEIEHLKQINNEQKVKINDLEKQLKESNQNIKQTIDDLKKQLQKSNQNNKQQQTIINDLKKQLKESNQNNKQQQTIDDTENY